MVLLLACMVGLIIPFEHTKSQVNIVSEIKKTDTSKYAVFAAGCFWGVEHLFRQNFAIPSQIIDVRVGYANGNDTVVNPSYEEVCTSTTNCAESVLISYEPANISYQQLVEFFFKMHDPTTVNCQGPNVGTQYRSAIFTVDEEQSVIAHYIQDQFQKSWYQDTPVVTVIEDLRSFYDAETYHQQYFHKNPQVSLCPSHFLRDEPGIPDLLG